MSIRHEIIEKNVVLLAILTLVTISIGGLVQIIPLFAVDNTTIAGTVQPIWLPFTNGNILVPGNVFVFTISAAVANAAVEISIPGAVAGTVLNFEVVITAGA